MLEIRQESCRIVYRDGQPVFLLIPNGEVHWFTLGKTTIDDLTDQINEKAA